MRVICGCYINLVGPLTLKWIDSIITYGRKPEKFKMSVPRISVIIPSYNRAHLLPRALASVYAQTLVPAEVIVVDDGSRDGTADLIQSIYPQVSYCYQTNTGVSTARNRGIRQATGDWIALLDSDDEWLPTKLVKQLDQLGRHPACRLCHSNEIWVRDGSRVNPGNKHRKSGGHIFQQCLPLCVISPSAALIHRSVFDDISLFDESLPVCEDYDLWLRICAREPVAYMDEALIIKYGGHQDQLSRQFWGMDRFRIRALVKILAEGRLSAADRLAATAMLRKKCRIYLLGARKRQKSSDITFYQNLLDQYVLA